jgi:hypothetical protein
VNRTRPTPGTGGLTSRRRWRGRHPGWMLAPIAAAALLAAGCGGGSAGDGRAASAASGGSDQAAKYSQCMRKNGVPEFPDPVDGQIQLRATPGGGLDPDSPEFKRAQQACRDLAPSGAQGGAGPPAEVQKQVLDYAKCIRQHGVPNFPDPDFSGGAVQLRLPRGGIDPNSKQFKAAQQACQDKAPQGLGGAP